jgi:topoisomerase-4 subunit A
LRKLEEMELKRERDALEKEREELQKLLDSEGRQRTRMKRDLAEMRKAYAEDTVLGKRRTQLEEAGAAREIPLEAMIEKEPATVILSTRGWIKAMKGHADLSRDDLTKFKEGDGPAFALHAQTTDRLILITDNGRFYSLGVDKLPGARGFGEPVRSMLDIDNDANIMSVLVFVPDDKFLVVADNGRGFKLAAEDVMSETRKGKQIVNLKGDARLKVARIMPDNADHIAAIGDNRKLVIFALADLPQMARGQGVQLQRYRDGGLSDAIAFCFADGLSWTMGGETGRRRTETDIGLWKVARGAAGRLPPNGFPRSNRFDD